ncbi:diguanylate cyclase [Paraburkholderia sp. C35]|uniref:sensor domain-containing diguanylate cyclase n=1 Tax=Paraburkholderia sp. C35 TaxID=2126993 RepID=UPI001EF52C5A|nr:diguanylate cyclase [Paraburkholderia sp. C35]
MGGPRVLFCVGLLVVLCMTGVCAAILYQARADALNRARETSSNLALLAERDIERNFELYDLSLQAAIDGLRDPEIRGSSVHLQRMALFDRAATARYLTGMLVLDAAGRIILDAAGDTPHPGNFSDMPYFTVHRDRPDLGLYVSDPFRSRLRDGKPTIALSRRISNPDGSFAGVVVIAVDLSYFRSLFGDLSLGAHGAVSLIGRDGIMIMRQPYDPRITGRDISKASTFHQFQTAPVGSFTETSSIDGVRRLYAFRNFPNLPLIVMVAEAESDIYAAWRARAIRIGAVMTVFGAAFIVLCVLLGRQHRERMRVQAELQKLARTDGLTGLYNRRTFDEILAREWRRAARTDGVMSLLFIDLDFFKAYNDSQGHQAGDDALAAVARCIRDTIRRPGDSAARYGGEEFVVVLPDTDEAGALMIAEAIRGRISDLAIRHATSPYGCVTASVGVACSRARRSDGTQSIVGAADGALYQAKHSGRNRVRALSGPICSNGFQAV